MSFLKSDILRGAVAAILGSLFACLVFPFVFRLPVPFWGMIGPCGEINPYDRIPGVLVGALVAWIFFGLLGGFILVSLSGAVAGYWAGHKYFDSKKRSRMVIIWGFFAGVLPVLFLSILDYFIGPW